MRLSLLMWLGFSVVCLGAAPTKIVSYSSVQYTGFGIADPQRDLEVVKRYHQLVKERQVRVEAAKPKAKQPPAADPVEVRRKRIEELRAELAQPPKDSGRLYELRKAARQNELNHLLEAESTPHEEQVAEVPAPDDVVVPSSDKVVVLVDSLPAGVELRDGHLSSGEGVTILGKFNLSSHYNEDVVQVLADVREFAAAAGANVAIVSMSGSKQGFVRSVAGIFVAHPSFDPKRVTNTALPKEI